VLSRNPPLLAALALAAAFVACVTHPSADDPASSPANAQDAGDWTEDEPPPPKTGDHGTPDPSVPETPPALDGGNPLPTLDASAPDEVDAIAAEATLQSLGQVLYVPFDDSDSIARDHSGGAHHGKYFGTTYAVAGDPDARERIFNGSSDYVRVPADPEVVVTGEMSILVWVRTSDPVAGDGPQQREILYRGGANIVFGWEKEVVEYHTWLRCYVSASYRPRVYQEVDLLDDSMALRDGRWHHYAVVFRPGDFLNLYVDGAKRVMTSTAAVPKINTSATDNAYTVGAKYISDSQSLSRTLNGAIANLRIFNHVVPDDAIQTAYRLGL
jgi:hypothetical protein